VAGRITKDPGQGYNSGEAAVWRFSSSGALDISFSNKGLVRINNGAAYAVKTDPSGKIFVAGANYESQKQSMALWILNSDGTINKTAIYHDPAGQQSQAKALSIDDLGKILISGMIGTDTNAAMAVWRYDSNGNIDTAFGSNGLAVYSDPALSVAFGSSLVIDPQNRILVGGFAGAGFGIIGDLRVRMALWRFK